MCYSAQVVQIARKLARTLGVRLDLAEAEKLFQRRLEDPRIAISRGFEANFDAPANEAERRIKAALQVAPNHAAALGNLGTVYLRMGRAEEAHRLFERTVRLQPDMAVPLGNLRTPVAGGNPP